MIVFSIGKDNYDLEIVDPTTFQKAVDFPKTPDYQDPKNILLISQASGKNLVAGVICDRLGGCNLWFWDMQTNRVKQIFETSNEANINEFGTTTENFKISPSGILLGKANKNRLYLWDVDTGQLFTPLKTNSNIAILAWHPSKNRIALALEDGSIQIWEITSSK